MMRFAQRLTERLNVRVKTLIRIGTTNTSDIPNSNSGVTAIGAVFASDAFKVAGSCRRYVSPFKLLNIPAAHNTARMMLTSGGFFMVRSIVLISVVAF